MASQSNCRSSNRRNVPSLACHRWPIVSLGYPDVWRFDLQQHQSLAHAAVIQDLDQCCNKKHGGLFPFSRPARVLDSCSRSKTFTFTLPASRLPASFLLYNIHDARLPLALHRLSSLSPEGSLTDLGLPSLLCSIFPTTLLVLLFST